MILYYLANHSIVVSAMGSFDEVRLVEGATKISDNVYLIEEADGSNAYYGNNINELKAIDAAMSINEI